VIRSVSDDREFQRLPSPGAGRAWDIMFSPDARFLAAKYHRDNQPPPHALQVWDLSRNKVLQKLQIVTMGFAFSPDSRQFVAGLNPHALNVYDLTSDTAQCKVLSLGRPWSGAAFHPDGRRVALIMHVPGLVQVHDLQTAKMVTSKSFPAPARALAWHPGGKRLAVGCAHPDCRIHLWDIESGGLRTLEGHQADVISLAYNHAGTLLASSSWDQTTRFWDAMSGRQLETVAAGSHSGFSTDDARVAVGDIIHEVTFGSEYRTLHGHQGSDKGPWLADISPDGQLVVSASGDGVRLW